VTPRPVAQTPAVFVFEGSTADSRHRRHARLTGARFLSWPPFSRLVGGLALLRAGGSLPHVSLGARVTVQAHCLQRSARSLTIVLYICECLSV